MDYKIYANKIFVEKPDRADYLGEMGFVGKTTLR